MIRSEIVHCLNALGIVKKEQLLSDPVFKSR